MPTLTKAGKAVVKPQVGTTGQEGRQAEARQKQAKARQEQPEAKSQSQS